MTPHYALSVVASVKPFLGQWLLDQHHPSLGLSLVVIAYGLVLRLSATQTTEDMERLLGAAVLEGLDHAKLAVKEAAALMAWDESNLRKALRGEPGHHISLNRLVRLPIQWWMWFLPTLTYLVMRQNVAHVAEDLGLRRSA
jgi:hypothetical protein